MAAQQNAGSQLPDADYLHYKNVFMGWARKKWIQTSDDLLENVFHDALIIFLKYNQEGKIKVAATTFIISVGNRLLGKQVGFQPVEQGEHTETTTLDLETVEDDFIRKGLKKLDEKCREILVCKYFYGFSMEEIKNEIGTKSVQAVRVQKHRCLTKLKTIVQELMQAA